MNALAIAVVGILGAIAFLAYRGAHDAPSSAPDPARADAGAASSVLDFFSRGVKTMWQLPSSAAPYADAIAVAEDRYNLPDGLLGRLLYQESRFRPEIVSGEKTSAAGAVGIAQFLPATAAELGADPRNPIESIDAAARYLRRQFDRFGDWAHALAAYNWGPGRVASKGLDQAPAETRIYVSSILSDVGLA
jgi:soluble lytic murein transglycosylase-like protein